MDDRIAVAAANPVRRGVLVAIAVATIILPQVDLYRTLTRFMSKAEALDSLIRLLATIDSARYTIPGLACAVLVLMCMKPRRAVAVLLGLLAMAYVFLNPQGPFSLLSVLLWLYVAIITYRVRNS